MIPSDGWWRHLRPDLHPHLLRHQHPKDWKAEGYPMLAEIGNRCEAVEECYEFMLAYAAQGLASDEGSKSGGQVRGFLRRAVLALTGLTEACAMAVKEEGLEPAEKYVAFIAVLD